MKLFHNGISLCALVTLAAMNSAVLTGCDDSGSGKAPAAATKDDHDPDHDADHADHADHDHGTAAKDDHSDHDHGAPAKDDHADQDDHGHGAVTALGETSAGGFMVNASLDGALAAGKEAAIDVAISSATAKAAAVRFWIGAEDGKGSMKAKAELESGINWHTHVDVPSPLAPDAKLWVEIEAEGGAKTVVSFALKS